TLPAAFRHFPPVVFVFFKAFLMTDDHTSGICLICSTPNTVIHFGIDACRACTAFFKRAKLSGRRFPCRRGDHECNVQRADGTMCKGCRQDKCIAIGMKYDGPMRKYNPKCEDGESSPSSTLGDESLLSRIRSEYMACIKRRRRQEQEIVSTHNLTRLPDLTEDVYLANKTAALACFNLTVVDSWRYFIAIFPWVDSLAIDDQREFFRHCIPQFVMVDSFCHTKKLFGGINKYSMCSILLCFGEEQENREELIESVRAYSHEQMSLVVPSFEKADICDSEKYALLVLLLCEADLSDDFSE
ncbi:hypothetical protein PENTCL1PPCAC_415, partial [Pristionchus entomophagus]